MIRGKAEDGKDLIMARDYVTYGIRQRAGELLTLELGPEIEFDKQLKLAREADAERFTNLDRSILRHVQDGILTISAMPPAEPFVHTSHMRRLKHLSDLGLATELQTGVWAIEPDIQIKLRTLGKRNDIVATMHRAMRESGIDRPSGSFSVFNPETAPKQIVWRVATLGLSDELHDHHYLVIDGVDGKVHYADLSATKLENLPSKGMIVALEAREQEYGKRAQVRLRVLSYMNLEAMMNAQGASWLDKELLSKEPTQFSEQCFGADARQALARRRQWLVNQSLATNLDESSFSPVPNLLARLRERELTQAITQLSKELNMEHLHVSDSEQVSGVYRQAFNLASGKFAVIQKAQEFTLVPWRPELEYHKDKLISGTVSGQSISWDWSGRRRGLGIG